MHLEKKLARSKVAPEDAVAALRTFGVDAVGIMIARTPDGNVKKWRSALLASDWQKIYAANDCELYTRKVAIGTPPKRSISAPIDVSKALSFSASTRAGKLQVCFLREKLASQMERPRLLFGEIVFRAVFLNSNLRQTREQILRQDMNDVLFGSFAPTWEINLPPDDGQYEVSISLESSVIRGKTSCAVYVSNSWPIIP